MPISNEWTKNKKYKIKKSEYKKYEKRFTDEEKEKLQQARIKANWLHTDPIYFSLEKAIINKYKKRDRIKITLIIITILILVMIYLKEQ